MGKLKSIYKAVTSVVYRWAMSLEEAELLMRYTRDGDHLEIGTLWGGSAIGVAMAKQSGEVYCIDPFNYTDKIAGRGERKVTIEEVKENIAMLGVTTVHLYKQKHPPMPPSLEKHKFDTALIDGEHTLDACLANWMDVKDRVDKYILFHDIDFVRRVKPVWKLALQDPEWKFVEVAEDMGVVRRIT